VRRKTRRIAMKQLMKKTKAWFEVKNQLDQVVEDISEEQLIAVVRFIQSLKRLKLRLESNRNSFETVRAES